MAITASQIAEVRLISGDKSPTKQIVSDEQITAWYNENNSICAVTVKVVQAMVADAARQLGGSGQATSTNPKYQALKDYLQYLRDDCPDSLPANSVITVNLGIDEETDLFDIE